jgi:hypothetical protein
MPQYRDVRQQEQPRRREFSRSVWIYSAGHGHVFIGGSAGRLTRVGPIRGMLRQFIGFG